MKISIFGGSNVDQNEQLYNQAKQLGKTLAEKGHIVITGGYIGIMEAVSRGANDAGGHVIGITCDEIEKWRPIGANPWVKEEIRVDLLIERIDRIIKECDVAIALPGGVGTLAEIMLAWNHAFITSIPLRKLVVVGKAWKELIQLFYSQQAQFIPDQIKEYLQFYETIDELIQDIESI